VLLEPGEGPLVGLGCDQFTRALAANTEALGLLAAAGVREVAEQGQHPAFEPAQQLGAFGVAESVGIGGHQRPHLVPIAHGNANVGEGPRQLPLENAALLGSDRAGLEIKHRLENGACIHRVPQRRSAAPSGSLSRSASAAISARILCQSPTATRTSASVSANSRSRMRRSLASTRPVSR